MSGAVAATAERQRRVWRMIIAVAAVAAAAAASIGLYGYAFGLHNHSIQIPFLRLLQDSTLYPGDRCMQAMRGYFSFFWPVMAWLTRWLPLEPTFFAGHIVTVAAAYAFVFAIARRAFPGEPRAPYLALWLVLFGTSVIGGEALHWFYFSHTPVATVLGLCAIYLALAGRWVAAFAVAGLVFNVHAMQSAYLVLMLAFAAGAEWIRNGRRVVLGVAVGVAVALPGVFWMLSSSGLAAPADLPKLLRAFFPVHFFASSFNAEQWFGLMVMLALLATCWLDLPRTREVGRMLRMCAAILLLWIVGGTSDELWPNALVLKLHVFRAGSYFCYLVLILFGGYLAAAWRRGTPSWIPPTAVVATALALALAGSSRWLAVACLLPFLWSLGRGGWAWTAAAVVAAGLFIAVWQAGLPGRLAPMPVVQVQTVFWPLLVGLAAVMLAPLVGAYRQLGATCVTLASLGWLVRHSQDNRMEELYLGIESQQSWFDVQQWAREHTSPDDLFLTPPDCEGFRVFSRRPVVGEWKDGAAVLWDASYADYWREWYQRVGGYFALRFTDNIQHRLAYKWFEKHQEGIEALARRYGADYIVLRLPDVVDGWPRVRLKWTGPKLYENDRFFVVRTASSAD